MKKKLLILLLSVISVICLAVGLSACNGNSESPSGSSDHEHSLVYYSAVDATETEDGHKEYWYCAGCGKYFSDSEGKNEIDAASIIIAALGENTTYTITFVADGNIISEITYSKSDTDIEIPEVPAKDGYDGTWNSFELYTGNITVNAVYTVITYYVDYDNTKGAFNVNPSQYTIEDGTITLNDLYLDGYNFNGWYTEDGEKITEISYSSYGSGIILIADWSLIEYTATFVDENGDTVATRTYTVETEYITVPEVPEKSGYAGAWKSYNLIIGGITISPVYTINAYTATFVDENGNEIYYATYTVENDSIYEPSVPYKQGYTGVWASYSLDIGGVTISPVYTAIKYNIIFVADDETVDTITYTVEDETIVEPQIPAKEGLDGEWEDYTLTYGEDVTVTALYTTEGATEGLVYNTTIINENGIDYSCYYISGYTGSATEIFIPSLYLSVKVKGISDYAFYEQTQITSISIADSVTYIGRSFYGCTSLESIVLPEGVTSISSYAFYNCTSLESIVMPESVTIIGNYSFCNCGSLESIVIPDGVESIGQNAFNGCSGLKSITLPFVGYSANSTSSSGLFGSIFGTTSYSGGVATKQYYSTGSSKYTTYYIPENLMTVTILGGNISYGAFYNCSSLTSISLGYGIETIGNYAFYNCNKLTSINIPDSVTSIGGWAFSTCSSLEEVYINDISCWSNISFTNVNANPLYYANNLYLNEELLTDLPSNVSNIGAYSFVGWSCLSLTIPDGVTTIGEYAFYECTSLEQVKFSDSVTTIDTYAFYACASIEKITFGTGLISIGDSSFFGCSLIKSLTIPENVTYIGSYAFLYCAGLTKLNYNATAADDLSLNNNAFYCAGVNGKGVTVTIGANVTKIPANLFYSYNSEIYAPKIIKVVFEDNSVCTDIGDYAFAYCSKFASISLPEKLTRIGNYAFAYCSNLTSISFSETVTELGSYAFYNCTALTSLVLPDGILSIEASAFRNCTALESVGLPANLTYISYSAFYGCTSLKEIVIPDSVTKIYYSAFEGCTSLEKATIGTGVTEIEGGVFYDCTSLTTVNIPEKVVTIGNGAFGNCMALTEITYNAEAAADLSAQNKVFYKAGQNGEGITVKIGADVTKIPAYLFCPYEEYSYAPKIIAVEFSTNSSCESIGGYAFCFCSSLVSITIPASITSIENSAFSQCYNLVEVYNLSELEIKTGHAENGCVAYYAKAVYTTTTESGLLTTQDGFTFYYDDNGNTYYLTGYTGDETDITLPTLIINGTEKTYEINQYAFYGNTQITSVIIPDCVSAISYYAFEYCTSLENLTIGNGVNGIGYGAFWWCTSLKMVTLGSGINYLDRTVFFECNSLESITVDENNSSYKTIDGNLYSYDGKTLIMYMSGKTDNVFYIPEGVETISSGAITSSSLESITIPDSVISIGEYAFQSCSSLRYITISKNIVTIDNNAFGGCESLEAVCITDLDAWCNITFGEPLGSNPMYYADYLYLNDEIISGDITLSESITSIPYGTFKNSDITSISIPDGVTYIEDYAFYNCTSLESVIVPNTVTHIYSWAFALCGNLSSVTLGDGIVYIASNAFYRDLNIKEVKISDISIWCNIEFGNASANPLSVYDYYMSDTVEVTALYINNELATEIVLSQDITSIGDYAFYNYTRLERITLSESVQSIGNYSFYGCSNLVEVYNLSSLEITAGSIDYGYIGCYAKNIYTSESSESNLITPDGYIFTRDSEGNYYLVSYSGTDTELTLPTLIIDGEEKEYSVNQYTFYGNKSITSIIIPATFSAIDDYMFLGCVSLKTVTILGDVTSIGNYAFYGCSSLTAINMPDSVTSIGNYAFYGCSSISSITIGENVTYIGNRAFAQCISLTEINYNATTKDNVSSTFSYVFDGAGENSEGITLNIGAEVTYIPSYLFSNCSPSSNGNGGTFVYPSYNIVNVYFAENSVCESIANGAFGGCYSLLSIVIPNSVTSIGHYAFWYCDSLTNITIGSNVNSIGNGAFESCTKLAVVYNLSSLSITVGDSGYGGIGYYAISVLTSTSEDSYLINQDDYIFVGDSDGNYYLISYLGSDTDLVLPTLIINGQNIEYSIYQYAFYGNEKITSIVVPDSVISIDNDAFFGCSSLTSINIPDSVKSIGNSVFFGCSSLAEISLGGGITSIGNYAFGNCTALSTITIPKSVTTIGEGAFAYCIADIVWEDASGLTKITYGMFIAYYGTEIIIPDSVTVIESSAFENCSSLLSITISPNIISIGSKAFYGCNALTAVYISDISAWLTISFGNNAANPLCLADNLYLYNAETDQYDLVTEIVIPNDIKVINGYVFAGCGSIKSITISDGVTSIGDYAFSGCTSLVNVIIPDSVTYIGNGAFSDCVALESITIGDGVKTIGDYAFSGCTSLVSVIIPDSVTSIGRYAFSYCNSLKSIVTGDGIETISSYMFESCYSLESVIIGNSVTSIEEYAFSYCTGLINLTISGSVKYIMYRAFYCCNSLESLILPDSLLTISTDAFTNCSSIKAVYYCGTVKEWNNINIYYNATFSDNGYLISAAHYYYSKIKPDYTDGYSHWYYDENGEIAVWETTIDITLQLSSDGKYYIVTGAATDDNVISIISEYNGIPVTQIADSAFYENTALKTIYIPDSITYIGYYAFYGCSSLVSIIIPESVECIRSYTFYGCTSLASITILNDFYDIENCAFYGCSSLTNIELSYGMTAIEVYAFYGCSSLSSIVLPESIKSINTYAFYGCASLTSINIPECVTSIGDYAFYGCSSLVEITIPKKVTVIGLMLFYGCTSLERVTMGSSVETIKDSAFYNCTSLASINIPDSVSSIGVFVFYCCSSLVEIIIPEKVTTIDRFSFANCTSLERVIIGSGVETVGYAAFYNCSSLSSIYIPESVTTIDDYAFNSCSSLISIILPDSVTSVGEYAFYNCNAFTVVYYSGNEDDWNTISVNSTGNDYLKAADIYYYAELGTTTESGKYWYYNSYGDIATWTVD